MNRNNELREAEENYTKATQAELSRNYDTAFRLYIKSAELFLHLCRSSPATGGSVQKTRWKASAAKALERAEKIKAFVDKNNTTPGAAGQKSDELAPELKLTPVGVNFFSPHEQFLVLKKGERVNGGIYFSWEESYGLLHNAEEQPQLSPEQLRQSSEWRRPTNTTAASLHRILPQEIIQNIVTDCSLCSSITVCLEHGQRFASDLLQGSLVPCPQHKPGLDFCGQYHVRIFFNGIWRRVIIDDKLPHSQTNGSVLCMSVLQPKGGLQRQHNIIWPSLFEKAYMKLMGGYEFLGSVSSTDLHALIGWIPEHIDIKSSNFEREKTWITVLHGFLSGHCMVTVGTGPRKECFWQTTQLLPSHSYAVVDVTEDEDGPTMTILNSWVPGNDKSHLSDSRFLRIPWNEVLSVFYGIYLSWDPSQWSESLTFHGTWKRRGQEDQLTNLRLRFNNVTTDKRIWILLTRHVVNSKRTTDFASLRVEVEDEAWKTAGAVIPQKLTEEGTFTNNTHILAKTQVSEGSGVLNITPSYDGDASAVGYTIVAYAGYGVTLKWDENMVTPPYTEKVSGVLTSKNSGGNGTYPTFMSNPQYWLRIHMPSSTSLSPSVDTRCRVRTSIVLKTAREVPVNVTLVWSQGERVYTLSERELAATSGPYSYGLATVVKDLSPGDYTVIVSAFEPQYIGAFSLTASVSSPFFLKPIVQEGAGMYKKVVQGEWSAETAGGGPSFNRYKENPLYAIHVSSQTQLKIRLQVLHPSATAPLNVTLYSTSSVEDSQQPTATSGPYDDAIAGVATPQFWLNTGTYWMVPSTYTPGIRAEFQLTIYSSVADIVIEQKQ
ncbi:hypothetical protein AMATHDRAFT_68923 [Amanita thiersii Skay4041]|uniref:Calpain catalytic domain-containing protein n=1 Tax=Amanita thiersii Skay4041 TaxID=703135 RepID=A0A2A9N8T3_9AGAR|nr:hypothetical protein AMATHDRAFT_68923 [Amanita thiersii Skay4041]